MSAPNDLNQRNATSDPATGKYYELAAPVPSPGASYSVSLYETTNGSYSKIVDLGTTFYTSSDLQDEHPALIVRNGYAYMIGQSGVGTSGTIRMAVARVNLSSGVVTTFVDGTNFSVPDISNGVDYNGTWGRAGYCEGAGVFVVIYSARSNVAVFKPPASWGTI
jgi:hypothetical protein